MSQRFTVSEVNVIEKLAPYIVDSYEQGAIIVVSDQQRITARYSSAKLDISACRIEELISAYECSK